MIRGIDSRCWLWFVVGFMVVYCRHAGACFAQDDQNIAAPFKRQGRVFAQAHNAIGQYIPGDPKFAGIYPPPQRVELALLEAPSDASRRPDFRAYKRVDVITSNDPAVFAKVRAGISRATTHIPCGEKLDDGWMPYGVLTVVGKEKTVEIYLGAGFLAAIDNKHSSDDLFRSDELIEAILLIGREDSKWPLLLKERDDISIKARSQRAKEIFAAEEWPTASLMDRFKAAEADVVANSPREQSLDRSAAIPAKRVVQTHEEAWARLSSVTQPRLKAIRPGVYVPAKLAVTSVLKELPVEISDPLTLARVARAIRMAEYHPRINEAGGGGCHCPTGQLQFVLEDELVPLDFGRSFAAHAGFDGDFKSWTLANVAHQLVMRNSQNGKGLTRSEFRFLSGGE